MHKFLVVTVVVLALSCVGFSSTGLSNEISNIQFQNVTQTSVDVVWTTVHPSTSQVLLARDTNYEPERLIPAIADPRLVTQHRVTVDQLVPYNSATGDGQYYIYVASVTATRAVEHSSGAAGRDGQEPAAVDANTADQRDRTSRTRWCIRTGQPPPTRGMTPTSASSPFWSPARSGICTFRTMAATTTERTESISPAAAIGVHYSCQWDNASGVDSAEQWYSAAMKQGFCYNGNNQNYHSVRLRVPANTPPGRTASR